MASPRLAAPIPTPVATLKEQSAVKVVGPQEYSVRIWLNAAKDSFKRGLTLWDNGQKADGDPTQVEGAFLAVRQGAELYRRASTHRGFKDLGPADRVVLNEVQQLAIKAQMAQKSIQAYLERREAEWVQRNGPIPQPIGLSSRGQTQAPTFQRMTSANNANGRAVSPGSNVAPEAVSSYSSNKGTPNSSPAPAKSPPLSSIKERMAALRSKGMVDPVATQAASTSRPAVNGHSIDAMSVGHARMSPPATPKPQVKSRGDLVEDTAMQRSGSAPPAIPVTDEEDQRDDGAFASLGLELSNGLPLQSTREPGSPSLSRSQPRQPSPTDFASSFPSLDDFERLMPGSSVNSSTYHSEPPLPPPPRPFEVDMNDFESQRRAHSDAVARLGGPNHSLQSTSRGELPKPPTEGRSRSRSNSHAQVHKPLPPPASSSTSNFTIPFTSEVGPQQLYDYLTSAQAEKGKGPRVLILDVRSREEFDNGRVLGETCCLEPIVLRRGITSSQIESALSLSPNHEQDMFAARGNYDMVVVYDRSSMSMPGLEPSSSEPESQTVLWNLTTAIYERDFYKHLKRQPVLLKGGWKAWETYVGPKGITVDGVTTLAQGGQQHRQSSAQVSHDDAKKANRRAAVLPPQLNPHYRDDAGPSSPPNRASLQNGYFPSSGYLPERANAGTGVLSPRLAMPPTAVQRSGSTPIFEGYSSSSFSPNQPGAPYPHQPSINGLASSSTPGAMTSLVRSRGDYGDLHMVSQQSFEPYTRSSIDYPQLQSRAPQAPIARVTKPTHPPPPLPEPVTRPPAIQPAPERSNSGSYMPIGTYSAQRSAFPTLMTFEDNVIGLTGLKNLGNTCYMNSTIQCLSAAVPFARYFKDRTYRRDVNTFNPHGTKGALADAVSELIRAIWAQNYTFLAPITFRDNICRFAPQFKGSDQHDAQEFLGFLLDGLHEDLNYVVKKPPPIDMTPDREHDLETLPPQIMSEREWEIYRMRDDSFVVQCFQGQFRNQLKCLTCGKTSTTYNTFMPLSIPIPSGRGASRATLEDCIRAFVREEILDKDDAWFCPQCKTNRRASKRLTLSRLPPILVIHLKRFSFRGPFSDKVETQVMYPLTGLDLTQYLPPPLLDSRGAAPKGKVYDLFGVTNHYGNLSSGHYTAFVRSGREWHNIGDSKVTQVDPKVVEGAQSAYILYYALR
ncbi:ubiquitin-specific protease doa4 [Microbotryomycetes sp. JL221]|nr:ubiquitin-specific protease doa4 [Microbotryomycetes sp. JL221]